jgi:lysophospholipase L1-like esterase
LNRILSILILVFCLNNVHSQGTLPYWNEIQAFKTADSISFPAKNQVLFVGSSSFRLWKTLKDDFPKHRILNRSFGGATLKDQLRYRYDVIFPYQPKQIVMYCGENDFAESDTVTSTIVVERFITLFRLIRSKYPDVPFAYVAMKPSPSRIHLQAKVKEANEQIRSYLRNMRKTVFIDVYSAMLNADGSIKNELFSEDRLHMNDKGYAIWKRLIGPYLLK